MVGFLVFVECESLFMVMRVCLPLLGMLVCACGFAAPKTKWSLDKAHASLTFTVKHMKVSNVSGSFSDFDVLLSSDSLDSSDLAVVATVKTKSLSTRNASRDAHLLGKDLLDADRFPEMKFESTAVEKTQDAFILSGKLTIKGITKSVRIPLVFGGEYTNRDGKLVRGFSVKAELNRRDFGVNFGSALEAVGAVGERIHFDGEFEFVQNRIAR